jgi:hypothetical protein
MTHYGQRDFCGTCLVRSVCLPFLFLMGTPVIIQLYSKSLPRAASPALLVPLPGGLSRFVAVAAGQVEGGLVAPAY